MKKRDYLILLGFILLISIGGYFGYKHNKTKQEKEKIEAKFYFPKTIEINNTTRFLEYDTTMMIIVNKIFGFDTIHIDVYYVTNNLISDEYIIQAHIIKHYFTPHSYILYINRNINRNDLLKIIVHELIHLQQYETGRLQLFHDFQYYVFDGDTNNIFEVDYLKRAYEIDAFKRTNEILNKYYEIIK